jgi:transcription initiation factor TFIIB
MDNYHEDMIKIMNDFYENKDSLKKEENKCINKDCNSDKFTLEDSNYICSECNTLQGRFIDEGAEWRYYGHNDSKTSDPTRCGMAASDLFPEFSLGSVIAYEYGKNSVDMRNLVRYQKWNSTSYKERTLYHTVEHIYIHASNNGISQTIIEEAKTLYKSLSEQSLHRGLSRSGVIASCLYWSCKKNKVPRSAKEISKMFNIDITTLTKGSKIFHNTLKINVDSTTAKDFIIRFCSNLKLDKPIVDLCIRIVDVTEELGIITQNTPPSLASSIIYLVCTICKLDISKKQISEINSISEVTINKTYKNLYKYRDLIIPSDIIYKYNIK